MTTPLKDCPEWNILPPPAYRDLMVLAKYYELPLHTKRYLWGIADEEVEEETIAEPVDLTWPLDAPDNVNSPAHYKTGGIECFDAMRAMLSGEEMVGYLRGNSFKYRWRFRKKGGVEDLEKAEWYERKLKEIIALLP